MTNSGQFLITVHLLSHKIYEFKAIGKTPYFIVNSTALSNKVSMHHIYVVRTDFLWHFDTFINKIFSTINVILTFVYVCVGWRAMAHYSGFVRGYGF